MSHDFHGGGGGGTTENPNNIHHAGVDMDMGMSMSFHFGVSETILFDFWKTTDVASIIGSIILVFFFGVAYEGLKFLREYIQVKHKNAMTTYNTFPVSGATEGGEVVPTVTVGSPQVSITSTIHLTQTALHFIQFVLSYCLMLIFMTFNIWLCLGVALGVATGYFFFGWKRQFVIDATDHCH